MWRCSRCGTDNFNNAEKCARCGATHQGVIEEPGRQLSTETKPKKIGLLVTIGGLAAVLVLSALAYFVPGWVPPTCETPETHRLLGLTRGEALGHKYTLATCTEPSVCEVCGEMSEGPIGHDWGAVTYVWSSDNTSVTAKRICSICGALEAETAETKATIAMAATCSERGKTTYTATFENGAFSERSKTVPDILTTPHDWGAVTYNWSSDNTSVTAEHRCSICGVFEIETAYTKGVISTKATCIEKGETTYTARFKNSAFIKQSKTVADIPATGHKWGEPTYTWSSDNSSVTAKRSCSVCGKSETETVKTTGIVSTAATCTTSGIKTYTSQAFGNKAFSVQTTTARIPANGHDWQAATYSSPKTCRICGETNGDPKGYRRNVAYHFGGGMQLHGNSKSSSIELESPAKNCILVRLTIELFDITGNPYGNWYLFGRDLNGKWHNIGQFELLKENADGPCTYEIKLDGTVTYSAFYTSMVYDADMGLSISYVIDVQEYEG